MEADHEIANYLVFLFVLEYCVYTMIQSIMTLSVSITAGYQVSELLSNYGHVTALAD